LHQHSFPELEIITADSQLTEIKKKSAKLIATFGEFKEALDGLTSRLERTIPDRSATSITLIHGDFHLDQLLLLDSGRLALFDFDELALGDPLQDLANFCADLYNHDFDIDQIQRLISDLFNAYQSASTGEYKVTDFDWHLCVQLLTRAYRAYIQQKPDLEQKIAYFIALAKLGYEEEKK
jgi:aminoglycoside phosphotransferase (APT) family kinase protein